MDSATRFTASQLDLATIDPATLFPVVSFESIRRDRISDLKSRLIAAGWEYDVDALEFDPGIYLQETSAYREMLKALSIQDAQKQVLLAFAVGPFLDRLGDAMGTARMPGELDDRYRGRIQLAPEAFSGTGTAGGYIYFAMAADPAVSDVGCAVVNRGTPYVNVELTIMSSETDGTPSTALVQKIYPAINATNVKLLTDTVVVRGAVAAPYSVSATLNILPGPDPTAVQTNALSSLNAAALAYKRLGLGVPQSPIVASLQVPGVDSVVTSFQGLTTQRWQFGKLVASNIIPKIIDSPPETSVGPF